ncbi:MULTISPECIES: hypothetical protein [unclassified Prochlorococcus]|uniref:hypothetical protein n=1 Tax=unclassified Prochlorococcus TaxID=2627481 RepID=UPI000533ADFB|nr:hypothetical protein EV12_1359 [Prochlorococcus sp. MIT 0701]KGG28929.1 hypothetical protein EV13_1443 [Prochlorococcus sp. MIT 0702]KGG37139.1 hypothetical protein EV14_0081 [Prochlorococcus sp. MIT 0703]
MCELCWVVFPRLLQDLRLSGENSYFFLVERAGVTGEKLVKHLALPLQRLSQLDQSLTSNLNTVSSKQCDFRKANSCNQKKC